MRAQYLAIITQIEQRSKAHFKKKNHVQDKNQTKTARHLQN